MFNTIAHDCKYDKDGYYSLIAKGPGINSRTGRKFEWSEEMGARFTAMTSGNVAGVYLGLTNYAANKDGGPVNVFLCDDIDGIPNIVTQKFLGTVTPTEFVETTNNSIVSLLVAKKVPVVEGWHYWLVLKPALETPLGGEQAVVGQSPLRMRDAWNMSLPQVHGKVDYSSSGGRPRAKWWPVNHENDQALPAFGITAWPRPWANLFRALPQAPEFPKGSG